jgi:nicotinamide-nucleotide amidase
MATTRASIITIGDELLIGQTIDTNSAWMAQRLNEIGIDVVRRVAVGDAKEAIWDALDEELSKAEIVLITGGLGPTADDITKPLLLEYFGGKLVRNEAVENHVRDIFQKRNFPVIERNLMQADVPDSCEVLFNARGTAPGMLFRKGKQLIVSMPGVPEEMKGIMVAHVLPILSSSFHSDFIVHQTILTAGLGESFLAEKIKDLEAVLPAYIKLAYLPHYRFVKLRLTGKGKDHERLEQEIEQHKKQLAKRLEEHVVALEDITLEQVIGQLLTAQNKTLGIAESCTGGLIGHKLTQVVGSSKFFRGSVVCYDAAIKVSLVGVDEKTIQENGVVSEQVAAQLATGAMKVLNTDFGIGITGVLGPKMEDDIPVGTVWIGVANKVKTIAQCFHFQYDRNKNKEIAADMAMLQLWKLIQGKI